MDLPRADDAVSRALPDPPAVACFDTAFHAQMPAAASTYALPAEWERYIKRMMHKPGSGIGTGDAKKIFDFLVYDSSIRKKALVDEKLATATPEEKKAAEDKIKEIRDKYAKP